MWENEYFGKPQTEFVKTKAYQVIDNVIGVVKIPKLNADTFEKDFETMLKSGMTFKEVQGDNKVFQMFAKMRLEQIEKDIYSKLDIIFKSET